MLAWLRAFGRGDASAACPFLSRIWEEAHRRPCAENPLLEQEIETIDAQVQKARVRIIRSFAAFEPETLNPEVGAQSRWTT